MKLCRAEVVLRIVIFHSRYVAVLSRRLTSLTEKVPSQKKRPALIFHVITYNKKVVILSVVLTYHIMPPRKRVKKLIASNNLF